MGDVKQKLGNPQPPDLPTVHPLLAIYIYGQNLDSRVSGVHTHELSNTTDKMQNHHNVKASRDLLPHYSQGTNQ